MIKYCLTGASGFIGAHIAKRMHKKNLTVISRGKVSAGSHTHFKIDLSELPDIAYAIEDSDVLIHCAGLAHVKSNDSLEELLEMEKMNFEVTINLATQAASLGIKRFVFISSVGVNGVITKKPFVETDEPKPDSPYAKSKYKAEVDLLKLANSTDMDVVIIRPPLVYGNGAPGNFKLLVDAVRRSLPLPFGAATTNRRSFVAIDNLVDFIAFCADYTKTPRAKNQIFFVSDGEDVSTSEFLIRIIKAYKSKTYLFPVPVSILYLMAKVLNKKSLANKLLDSLQIDSTKANSLLGWKQVITMDEQLKKMVELDN